jgi:acyl-CoA thioesterase FadM
MYRLRFLWIILKCFAEPMLPVMAPRSLRFRAIPLIDTDFSRMFTHAYSMFMGLARWHLLFGSEFRGLALRLKWAPVTTSEVIAYKRSIQAFQSFELKTKIIYWDERRFYVEHLFLVGNQVCVRTLIEGMVRSPQGVLKPGEVFSKTGFTGDVPTVSAEDMAQIQSLAQASALAKSTPVA